MLIIWVIGFVVLMLIPWILLKKIIDWHKLVDETIHLEEQIENDLKGENL